MDLRPQSRISGWTQRVRRREPVFLRKHFMEYRGESKSEHVSSLSILKHVYIDIGITVIRALRILGPE